MKKRILKYYGNGKPSVVERETGISMQRINKWSEQMTTLQIDGLIAKLVRMGKPVPRWLR